jgi:hypothetical protein
MLRALAFLCSGSNRPRVSAAISSSRFDLGAQR